MKSERRFNSFKTEIETSCSFLKKNIFHKLALQMTLLMPIFEKSVLQNLPFNKKVFQSILEPVIAPV